jgi:hypothetical protein
MRFEMTDELWDAMQQFFAHPGRAGSGESKYCVGGAFCTVVSFMSDKRRCIFFPAAFGIAEAIYGARGEILHAVEDAEYDAAYRAAQLNDDGRFDEAWKTLRKAVGV